MKNFARSVWDLMSLISPPSPLNPKNLLLPPAPHSAPGLKLAKIHLIGNKKQEMKQQQQQKKQNDQKLK